jgi:hypothetical protein
MRLDVVDRHGAGLAADVDDEILDAGYPNLIGAAVCGC